MPGAGCLLGLASLSQIPDAAEVVAVLDEEERRRASRMRAEHRRRQFQAGHWLARVLATRRFGGHVEDWRWLTAASGQPRLRSGAKTVQVSVSHSGDWVACAVAETAIGLDLELSPRRHDWRGLARHAFAAEEQAELGLLAGEALRARFLELWSLKEAQAKRSGEGLQRVLMRNCYPLPCPASAAEALSWPLQGGSLALAGDAGLDPEFCGSAPPVPPRCWRFVATGAS